MVNYDGIGSTVAITDANENIVNKYAYDTFGAVIAEEETIENPFKYVGAYGVMDEGLDSGSGTGRNDDI